MADIQAGAAVGTEDYIEIQRFLFHEAALLDRRRYRDWFALLTDDIVYRITAQVARRAEAGELEYAVVDEDVHSLGLRVEQISDPALTHAENPPSLTRRFVSNLEASHADIPDTFVAESNILVYRNRGTAPEGGFYVGQRRDVLRMTADGLRLARRHVRLDQTIIYDGAMSTLL